MHSFIPGLAPGGPSKSERASTGEARVGESSGLGWSHNMQPLVGPMISYQASINGSYYGLVSVWQCGLIKKSSWTD